MLSIRLDNDLISSNYCSCALEGSRYKSSNIISALFDDWDLSVLAMLTAATSFHHSYARSCSARNKEFSAYLIKINSRGSL